MVICLQRDADLHMAQLMPLPLTVSCFSKIQIGLTFLVPAHLGSPGRGPLNGCVCVLTTTLPHLVHLHSTAGSTRVVQRIRRCRPTPSAAAALPPMRRAGGPVVRRGWRRRRPPPCPSWSASARSSRTASASRSSSTAPSGRPGPAITGPSPPRPGPSRRGRNSRAAPPPRRRRSSASVLYRAPGDVATPSSVERPRPTRSCIPACSPWSYNLWCSP